MPRPFADLSLPLPLAVAVVLAIIAVAIYAVRAHGRRMRRGARRQCWSLAADFRRFLDGNLSAAQLLRATEQAEEGTCWTVLESLSFRIGRPEWLRLSQALEESRHAAAERRALADDSPWRRVLAARRLALLRSRASWRALRRAMTRGPEMVTFAAAMALARYRDRGALRWILAHQDALARRHRNALVALLKAFRRSGLPVMAQALTRGGALPRFELAMIDALGAGRYHEARPFLERRLEEGDLDLRAAAARALGLMQAIECATTLIAALKDEAWQVRAQAAKALGRVRAPLATHALAARLTDPSWWVRHHAAYALMEMGEDGQAALRHIVAASTDPYARDMAREALEGEIKRLTA
jgi:HEAT repeat protein